MRTSEDILNDMLADMPNTYAKSIGFPVYDLLNSVAIESEKLYIRADEIEAKLDIENLSGDELTRRVFDLTGIVRRPAVKAIGEVTVTGTATIQPGALFSTVNNILFEATAVTIIKGTGKVPIQAVEAGAEGNVGTGSIIKIPVSIPGITAVTNKEPTRNGYREENDEELKARFYAELQKPIVSGNEAHYERWALEVAGVGRAKAFGLAFGDNTVEVCIIGNDGLPASPELVSAVQQYIDPGSTGKGEGQAPAGAYCTVTAATEKQLNIDGTLILLEGYELAAVVEAIKTNIKAILQEKAFNVDYISYALIANTIFDTPGVIDYSNLTINGDVANIPVGSREVATLGTVNLIE